MCKCIKKLIKNTDKTKKYHIAQYVKHLLLILINMNYYLIIIVESQVCYIIIVIRKIIYYAMIVIKN